MKALAGLGGNQLEMLAEYLSTLSEHTPKEDENNIDYAKRVISELSGRSLRAAITYIDGFHRYGIGSSEPYDRRDLRTEIGL